MLKSDAGEDAECHAAKLLEVLLLQYRGLIDQVVHESRVIFVTVCYVIVLVCVSAGLLRKLFVNYIFGGGGRIEHLNFCVVVILALRYKLI